jgi:hypothetical protein
VNPGVSLPPLHILKVGCINSLNYKAILSACPNLRYLDISITAYYQVLPNIVYHTNLVKMIIRIVDYVSTVIDDTLNSYLLCVPYLKRLTVYLGIFDYRRVQSFVDYDWLGSTIDHCLPKLQSFTFYVYFYNLTGFNESQITTIMNRINENFKIVHKNRYRSRLFIHYT